MSRGGHIYTCCTDTRDRDQSEIMRSSSKIGDDQAIKTSVYTARGVVLGLRPYPAYPRLAIKGQAALLTVRSSDQGPKIGPIKF